MDDLLNGVKISELPEAAQPEAYDVLAGVQNQETRKFSFSTILQWMRANIAAEAIGAVPDTREINGHELSADVTLTAADVGAIPVSQKGAAGGVAELGNDGKVPSAQLPSYVDDVLEYPTLADFPVTGENGKIYVALDTNRTYRWSGSAYVEISESLALGETSSTAYRGDRGKIAYDHSQTVGNPHGTTAADVGARPNDWMPSAADVGAIPVSQKGAAGGVAELGNDGKVPTEQLPPISSAAADISYDNTSSGLTATDVQDAIDEVYGDIPIQASDIGAQDTITASGILMGDGQGGVRAAVAGTDYQAPLTAGTDYATPAQLDTKANQTQLAYVETGTTASRNYTAGQYISLSGLLYTADTAIASGATFYTSGGNKNLTECVGGGLNSVYRLVSYSLTHLAFRVNNVVFVHFRSNVDLGGGTTTVFLSGLPVPDTSKSHTWQFPVNVNFGIAQILPGYVTVESNGDLSIMVVNNGSFVTSGRFTVSIFLMYLTA